MPNPTFAALFAPSTRNLSRWLLHLGGIGLIPLGLIDSSVIPLPGSMDFATILLSARANNLWFYYAIMATVGSVLGAFLTYRLARKGGKEALARKLSKRKAEKALKTFERWGFAAIAVPALLPPPFPMVPFVIAAGAMQYPLAKFLSAMTLGRILRYSAMAFIGATYGRHILSFFTRHAYAMLFIAIGIGAATVMTLVLLRKRR
jgi:membrane protein YqaA with SNARE-associated domain